MTTSIKGSARRLGVMASQGNKIAVFKLAGIIVATVVVLWWILSWFWWEVGLRRTSGDHDYWQKGWFQQGAMEFFWFLVVTTRIWTNSGGLVGGDMFQTFVLSNA
jgi:hypothetical protein